MAGPRVARRHRRRRAAAGESEIVVSIETAELSDRPPPTTVTYDVVDVPVGPRDGGVERDQPTAGSSGPTVGEARRDGSLGVDLTAGKNHVDIQL